MAFQVVVTDHVFDSLEIARAILEPVGAELLVAPSADEATLRSLAGGADAMIVCYARITEAVVEAAKGRCRIMARTGIGYDNIPVESATAAGILVTNVPDYCIDEVADHTLTLLLAASRGLVEDARLVGMGKWGLPSASIHRLRGRRLVLLGLGRIGREVASRAAAFGMEVAAYDPYLAEMPAGIARIGDIDEALSLADVLSLHLPLSPQTHHLISDSSLARMKATAILVNTSRGGLVDLDAVARALDSGQLAAAALDVTEPEPPPADHRLRDHPRAILTAHMAYYSVEAQDELLRRTADEVARSLSGRPPRCPVNPQVLGESR